MSQVSVSVNGRSYIVACDEGEEEHLRELSRYIDKHVSSLADSIGQVGDSRLLLMAGLLVCDELSDALTRLDELEQEIQSLKDVRSTIIEKAKTSESQVAEVLESAARRVEDIAARLEDA
ncbi:MAG: cell division protein ZapA [Alphaproteobacteria bacterium]|nr:cell division protein ZapA [Alphaproteobacteria bacterium]